MATRKKAASESENLNSLETAPAAPKTVKSIRARKPAGESTGGAKKAAKPNIPAATHKAPARKAAAAEKADTPAFDVALHHEEISLEAYYNWLRRGCPHGSEQEDWLAAVATVRTRYAR